MHRNAFAILAWACSSLVACESFQAVAGDAGRAAPPDAGPLPASDAASPPLDASCQDCNRYRLAVLSDTPKAFFRLEESGGPLKNEISNSGIDGFAPGAQPDAPGITADSHGLHLAQNSTVTLTGPVFTAASAPFTVEAWLQWDDDPAQPPTTNVPPVVEGIDGAPRTGTWLFLDSAKKFTFRTETWSNDVHLFYALTTLTPVKKQWYHVAFGYSDSSGQDFLYVNGVEAISGPVKTGMRRAPKAATQFRLVGTLDEVAVYDRALTTARILAHFSAK
jgi:Concanavalin A-like lectin/glucanases superfamily